MAERSKPWVIRTYSGHSTAVKSNELYRGNLAKGQTGLSIAFDLPTQTGYDPDDPAAAGEVGKVGVPVGGVNESAVVGNLEIQYRVNEDGTLNLRVFNRENEINYLGEGIGYTQGVGLTYEVDFDTFKELLSKIFKKTTLNIEKKPKEENQDTITKPDFINFSDEKKKTK